MDLSEAGRHVEAIRRNHYQQEDPGTVWHKDEGIVIDVDEGREPHRVLTPNFIVLPGGGACTTTAGIRSAENRGSPGALLAPFPRPGTC